MRSKIKGNAYPSLEKKLSFGQKQGERRRWKKNERNQEKKYR